MVRAASVIALGHVLTHPQIVEKIAEAPDLANTSKEFWQTIIDKMVDSDDEVVSAAFSTVTRLLSVVEATNNSPPSPATAFLRKSKDFVFELLMDSLASLLYRAADLEAGAQVSTYLN